MTFRTTGDCLGWTGTVEPEFQSGSLYFEIGSLTSLIILGIFLFGEPSRYLLLPALSKVIRTKIVPVVLCSAVIADLRSEMCTDQSVGAVSKGTEEDLTGIWTVEPPSFRESTHSWPRSLIEFNGGLQGKT